MTLQGRSNERIVFRIARERKSRQVRPLTDAETEVAPKRPKNKAMVRSRTEQKMNDPGERGPNSETGWLLRLRSTPSRNPLWPERLGQDSVALCPHSTSSGVSAPPPVVSLPPSPPLSSPCNPFPSPPPTPP